MGFGSLVARVGELTIQNLDRPGLRLPASRPVLGRLQGAVWRISFRDGQEKHSTLHRVVESGWPSGSGRYLMKRLWNFVLRQVHGRVEGDPLVPTGDWTPVTGQELTPEEQAVVDRFHSLYYEK